MENSDLDLDLDSEEIDNVVTNTVIYQNNFGFMRNEQNTFIARFNDISINTFILSPGPPINMILKNNIKEKYKINSSLSKNIVIHKKQDPSYNNIECCCCMDNNKKLSIRAYRSCKAEPKHSICKECFEKSNKRECFYCFPYGKNTNIRREQVSPNNRIFTIQEINNMRQSRRRNTNIDNQASVNLCFVLFCFSAVWLILTILSL